MTMINGSDGLDGEADELVLKDEISGSDDGASDSSSVQILDDENGAADERKIVPLEESGELAPFDSFVVDTEAVEEEAENSAYQHGDNISSNFSFSQVISHFTPVPKEKKRSDGPKRSAGKTCFNCGAVGHELSKCPEPRDARRISQNRNSFGRRRESAGVAPRFHEQHQGPQPGVVSDNLRDALGIGPRELPPWIYRMRKLGLLNGYPPAYRNRATERLTVKFHLEEEVTSTEGHRRKRKHAEATGEDDKCQIQTEKLIRYPGFNSSDDNCVDVSQKKMDSQQWLIPPWDTFVQAQQHHVDTCRRRQQRDDGDIDGEAANKRSKMSVTLDETNEILVLDEEDEEEGEISDEEGEGDENGTSGEDGDVLFVDASRTKKRNSAAANTSLEEGEIVDESEEEQQKMDTDLRQKKHSTKKAKSMRSEKKKINGKRSAKKLDKRRRKGEANVATAGEAPPPSSATVSREPCPSTPNAESQSPLKTTTTEAKPTAAKDGNEDQQQMEGEAATALLLKMQLGTPVPTDYAVEKPALEKWSIGIQAFQHQPPATSTGFFKRMHQIVKSVRKNPHAIGGGESDDKNEQKTDEQKR